MYGSSLTGPALYQGFNPTLQTMASDKGKAKAQDADFEAAFAQAAASLRITDSNSSATIVELETSSTAVEPVSEAVKTSAEFSELVSISIARVSGSDPALYQGLAAFPRIRFATEG